MHERITGKNKIRIMFSILVMLCALSGYLLSATNEGITKDGDDVAASVQSEERINENCEIEIRYEYTLCSHTKVANSNVSMAEIGISKEEFAEKYEGYSIDAFSSDKVIVSKRFDTYCDEHFIVKEQNGEVHILRNKMGTDEFESVMKAELIVENIPEKELKKLRAGRVFPSLEEAHDYIEAVEK